MAQKPKEKVARSAPKKPATRTPKPKKKTQYIAKKVSGLILGKYLAAAQGHMKVAGLRENDRAAE